MLTPKLHTQEQYQQFKKLFGVNLRTYWDNFTGFDLIKFDDEVVKPKDGTSTRQAVRKKYGKEGVELIESLIGYNKQENDNE